MSSQGELLRLEGGDGDMSTPMWLLDIDGVLNTYPRSGKAKGKAVASDGKSWNICWDPAVIQAILDINTAGLAEVFWCTTWEPETEDIEKLLGMPALPKAHGYIDYQGVDLGKPMQRATAWTKRACFMHFVGAGRPVVWTDDDAIPDDLLSHHLGDTNIKLVRPDQSVGLTLEEIDDIREFLMFHELAHEGLRS